MVRWFLPVLALLTVLGIIALGTWLVRSEPAPTAKTVPLPQGQLPTAAQPQPSVVQASIPTSSAQDNQPIQPSATLAPVTAAQAGTPASPAILPGPPTFPAAGVESLIDPLPTEQALAPGEPVSLRAIVGGVRTQLLSPNQVGSFPRVYLPQGGQADVQMQLPEAATGDRVVAAIEDGGRFANGQSVQAFTLGDNHQIAFQFQATQSVGTFRVSVRHNAQTKIVTFWAGDRTTAFNY